MEIEFDAKKAESNLRKHNIAFEEAASSLFDPGVIAIEDPDSYGENRWVSIGMSDKGRLLTTVYTYGENSIRLISARRSTRRETEQYA